MALDRDAIFTALLTRLRENLPEAFSVEDRIKPWTNVPATEQPAVFVVKGTETPSNERGLPPKWTLTATVYLYAHEASRPGTSAQRQVNLLMQKIEKALERTATEAGDGTTPFATTLGGLVSHAWIDGTVQTDEGALGDQAVLVIPITMLATG